MRKPCETITAMICLTTLEGVALFLGFNGVILIGVMTIIAGLGGYELKAFVNKFGKE